LNHIFTLTAKENDEISPTYNIVKYVVAKNKNNYCIAEVSKTFL
jgi:hypothetical protein